MKEIFEKIKGREWDWFGKNVKGFKYTTGFLDLRRMQVLHVIIPSTASERFYSLADLLANKSWCKAVWGEEREGGDYLQNEIAYIRLSQQTFKILQQEGEQAAIDYIKSTML